MPTITAVIPSYNRARMLAEAIDSVLQQTRPPEEIIVVDDGSTDNTPDLMAGMPSNVVYIRQPNSGPSAARNRGIREASGDFVAFLDSDDLWVRERIERQLAALSRYPQIDFLFGLEAKFTAQTRLDRCEIKDHEVFECLNQLDIVVPDPFGLLLRENFVPTSSVLFRKKCIDSLGFIDESIHQAEDYDFWLRFAMSGFRFGFINSFLCRRRLHEGNLVNQWVDRTISSANVLARFRDIPRTDADRKRLVRRIYDLHYDLGSYLLRKRDFKRALFHLEQTRPSKKRYLAWFAKLAISRMLSH